MKPIPRPLGGLVIILCMGTSHSHAQVQVIEQIRHYQSGKAQVTVECFSPAAQGKFPAVVLLHGSGGLLLATGDLFRETARGLVQQGYVVLIPHYFETTGHVVGMPFERDDIPAYLVSVHDAIEFAADNPAVDSERIGLIGLSMGSYLAFYRAAKDPRIKAVVSVSGSLPVESKSQFPPVLILQGAKDKSFPASRLKEFQAKLSASNTPYVTHVYRHAGHNFDLATWEDATRRTARFFDAYLKFRPPGRASKKKGSTAKANPSPPSQEMNRGTKHKP